jgi:hypothetical protein
MLRGEGV